MGMTIKTFLTSSIIQENRLQNRHGGSIKWNHISQSR
jgi:hypothetical protein